MPAATLGIEDPQAQGGAPCPLRDRMPMETLAPPLLVPPQLSQLLPSSAALPTCRKPFPGSRASYQTLVSTLTSGFKTHLTLSRG